MRRMHGNGGRIGMGDRIIEVKDTLEEEDIIEPKDTDIREHPSGIFNSDEILSQADIRM